MAQIFEMLKGKIDVSKYEEEAKNAENLKRLKYELESINIKIFSNSIEFILGNFSCGREELCILKKEKEKEISDFIKEHSI